MPDKTLFQTLTFKLQVMGIESDCQALWHILDDEVAQQYLSRQFQRAIKEVVLRADQVIAEDFTFQFEMSENWHRPIIKTVSRDQNFFAAISRVNAGLRAQGEEAKATQFLAELEAIDTDGQAWALIGQYAADLKDDDTTLTGLD